LAIFDLRLEAERLSSFNRQSKIKNQKLS